MSMPKLKLPTDCYPRANFETTIMQDTINQFCLFNLRNIYQNFIVDVNGGDHRLFRYLGPFQPRLGNAVYSNSGAIIFLTKRSRFTNCRYWKTVFLGGGIGYVAWEGAQDFPL